MNIHVAIFHMGNLKRLKRQHWAKGEYIIIKQGEFLDEKGEEFTMTPQDIILNDWEIA